MLIRAMTARDLGVVLGWARDEGWNPGLDDAAAFLAADPGGFRLGEIGAEAVASVSVVRHAPDRAFLGLYICRPDHRGRGHGLAVWRDGIARAGDAAIGLDGVPAQQENYRRSGFAFAHRNVRWTGPIAGASDPALVPVDAALLDGVHAYDAGVTGYARPAFLRAWLAPAPTRRGLALVRDGAVRGYGVIRACAEGAKIGPLYADDPADAPAIARGLAAAAPPGPVALDAPEPNGAATALARAFGLAPVFETARMWRGPAPAEDVARVFGVASFELG